MSLRLRRVLAAVAVASIPLAALSALWLWRARKIHWDDPAVPPPPAAEAIRLYAEGKTPDAEKRIRVALRRYRAPEWSSRLGVLAAWHMTDSGNDASIEDVLPDVLPSTDPLRGHAAVLRARAHLRRGRPAAAEAVLVAALSAEGFPGRDDAIRLQAEALEQLNRRAEALRALDATASLAVDAARTALRWGDRDGGRRRLVASILSSGPGDLAERALDLLLKEFPEPTRRFTAGERRHVAETAHRWREAGRLSAALDLIRAGRPRVAQTVPFSRDEALVEAEILVRLGRGGEAAAALSRLSTARGEISEGVRYLTARVDLAAGRGGAARSKLEVCARAPGRSRWRLLALVDLARIAEGRPSRSALAAYERYREAAGSAAEVLPLWREAWVALDLGMTSEADRGIRRVLARADAPPSLRSAALYWAARRAEAQGASGGARSLMSELARNYPSGYYGILAQRASGTPPPPHDEPGKPASSPRDPARRLWLQAARLLRSVGLWEAAGPAYRAAAKAGDPAEREILREAADAALQAGRESEAVDLALRASRDRESIDLAFLPLRLLRLLYPAPSGRALESAAADAGLDPHLVASIVLQESAFNPSAVSAAGARGLLQVMPSTGDEVARRLGIRGFDPGMLFEPAINLRIGCRYFREVFDRMGTVPVALAAYNAGPSRAARWQDPGDDPSGIRYVERVPIPETRGYVKRILAGREMYRRIYPAGFGRAES